MRSEMLRRLFLLGAISAVCATVVEAQGDAADSAARLATRPLRYHVELGGFYQQLDNSYPDWRGVNLKLQRSSPRYTPFVFFSSQSREAGSQQNYGAGSYIVVNRHAYLIAGFSFAPGTDPVLYPKLRWDVQGLVDFLPVPGLVLSAGLTELRYSAPSAGRIVSAGSMYYRGHAILSGVVRFNTDKPSGAHSRSASFGGQYGSQGRAWVGGEVTTGNEAYRVLSDTPFDARFRGTSASAFLQKWLAPRYGFAARYDFENKYGAYRRNGLTLSYFVDF